MMPRKRKQSRVAARQRLASGQHRTLVYVDDGGGRGHPDRWGYWCQQCPAGGVYSSKPTAERMADRHKAASRKPVKEMQTT